jgi:hypothetical protein
MRTHQPRIPAFSQRTLKEAVRVCSLGQRMPNLSFRLLRTRHVQFYEL